MRNSMVSVVFFTIAVINTEILRAAADAIDNDLQTLIRTSRDLFDSNDLVPILNIPGTKLFTGLYYKVGMKVFPRGWITWTENKNYIEVELDPSQLPNYEPGKPFENDNQWSFGASESELGYTLMNRGKPLGFLIWVSAGAGTGYHVSIYDDPESIRKMSAGGEWRNDVLWIPQPTNEENYFKIENLAKRRNFLTWAYKKHNQFNNYIQMGTYDAKEDSKFSFLPSRIKLEAKIYDFEYSIGPEDILKRDENIIRSLVVKKHFPNFSEEEITSTVEESAQTTDSVTIAFKQSLTMMHKTIVGTDSDEYSFEGGFEANKAKSLEVKTSLLLKQEIKIPAYTDIEASIYTLSAKNVEIPFTAKMRIIGIADRMVVDRPGETKEGRVPADVVEDFIKSSGKRVDIIDRYGDDITVRVSGVIKGSAGLKMVMDTEEVAIWTKPTADSSFHWD